MLWILGDVFIVLAALMIAVRGWLGQGLFGADSPYRTNLMFRSHPTILLGCLGWFMLSLILVSKRYHLYGPMQMRNTLHEQRLTIQACLTAGLLLSGALYLVRGEIISRGVVIITVVATTVLLCGRRLIWRMMMYRRFERGLEVRNIIIVGTGRVGQAMRHHLDSIRHLGYSFKGYVQIPGVDSENPALAGDVLGSIDQLLPLARQFFADEIFLSAPCDARVVTQIVTKAREAGVDIRVVPELYDGLAWNSPIEYIGQFPTIPLHRGETPVIGLFLKRILDVLLSSMALLVLSPLIAVIALLVKIDSPGPIFYCSDRIGKKGRVFRCIKFRTMVADAERRRAEVLHMNERDGVLFKVSNDPRDHRVWPVPAQVLTGRTASISECAARRYEHGRPPASHRQRGQALRSEPFAAARRAARHDWIVAGTGSSGPFLRQLYFAGYGVHPELEYLAGYQDSGADAVGGSGRDW